MSDPEPVFLGTCQHPLPPKRVTALALERPFFILTTCQYSPASRWGICLACEDGWVRILSYLPHVIHVDEIKVLMALKSPRKPAIPLEYPSTVKTPSYWVQCVGIREIVIGPQYPDREQTSAAERRLPTAIHPLHPRKGHFEEVRSLRG